MVKPIVIQFELEVSKDVNENIYLFCYSVKLIRAN